MQIVTAADGLIPATNPTGRYVTGLTPASTTTDVSVKSDSGFWSQSFDSYRISMAALEGRNFAAGSDEGYFMIGLNDSQEYLCVSFVHDSRIDGLPRQYQGQKTLTGDFTKAPKVKREIL